jgi:hypothetical protein
MIPLSRRIFSRREAAPREAVPRRHAARRTRSLALLLLLVSILMAGCAGGPTSASWAGLAVDDFGLIVANMDRVTRINVEAGTARRRSDLRRRL